MNLAKLPVEVSGVGFDMIFKALNSPYGYNGEMEKIYIKSDNEENDGDDHTNFNSHVSPEIYNNPEEKEKFEESHKSQKL